MVEGGREIAHSRDLGSMLDRESNPSPGAPTSPEHKSRSGTRRRVAIVIGLLLTAIIAYVGLFLLLSRPNPDAELFFGMAAAEPPLDLTLNMVSVDPVRQAIDVRIEAAKPSESRQWQQRSIEPADIHNFVLHVDDRYLTYHVPMQDSRTKTVLEIGLSGSISGYPLDHYGGRLSISAQRRDSDVSQPVRLTVWPVLSNWNVDIAASDEASKASGGIDLRLRVNRPTSFIVMAFAFYAAMAVIGLSGLTIGALVFLGVRPMQPPMTGALAAMIFSIPALRGIMPGAPPLGIHADVLILVWVELAVILGLSLFVITWVSRR
jgi:hypothetical protein